MLHVYSFYTDYSTEALTVLARSDFPRVVFVSLSRVNSLIVQGMKSRETPSAGPGPARAALPRVGRARRRRALPLRHHARRGRVRGLLRAGACRRARRPPRALARRGPRLVFAPNTLSGQINRPLFVCGKFSTYRSINSWNVYY